MRDVTTALRRLAHLRQGGQGGARQWKRFRMLLPNGSSCTSSNASRPGSSVCVLARAAEMGDESWGFHGHNVKEHAVIESNGKNVCVVIMSS